MGEAEAQAQAGAGTGSGVDGCGEPARDYVVAPLLQALPQSGDPGHGNASGHAPPLTDAAGAPVRSSGVSSRRAQAESPGGASGVAREGGAPSIDWELLARCTRAWGTGGGRSRSESGKQGNREVSSGRGRGAASGASGTGLEDSDRSVPPEDEKGASASGAVAGAGPWASLESTVGMVALTVHSRRLVHILGVAAITGLSAFPSDDYETYQDYFRKR